MHPQPLHRGGGLQPRRGVFPGGGQLWTVPLVGSAPAPCHHVPPGVLGWPRRSVYSPCLASIFNFQEHKAAGEQGGRVCALLPPPPWSCWQDGSDAGSICCRCCAPTGGLGGGFLAILQLPRIQWVMGTPQPHSPQGGTPPPGPSLRWPATLPPAAVDSQAPTSSPGAEPELLLQARLKCTKCSTCKICSVRK